MTPCKNGHYLPKGSANPQSMTILYAVLLIGRTHESGKSEVTMGIAQLTINPSDPLLESVLPVPSGFCKVRGPGSPRGGYYYQGI